MTHLEDQNCPKIWASGISIGKYGSTKSKFYSSNCLVNIVVHIQAKYRKDGMNLREPIRFERRTTDGSALDKLRRPCQQRSWKEKKNRKDCFAIDLHNVYDTNVVCHNSFGNFCQVISQNTSYLILCIQYHIEEQPSLPLRKLMGKGHPMMTGHRRTSQYYCWFSRPIPW